MKRKKTKIPDFSASDPPRKKPAEELASADDRREPDEVEIDQIVQWAITGLSEIQLRQQIAAELPNVHPAQALQAAMLWIGRRVEAHPAMVMAFTFEAARELYHKLVSAGEYAEALKALKFMNQTACQMADPKYRPNVPTPEDDPASKPD